MKRIRLTVAYDGTGYCGWQLQPNGITIEEVLNRAISELLKEPVSVIGASRTDSGVHALGNVAVFDTESRIPGDKICFALNQRLPEDIRILDSEEVPLSWHPRKQNCVKTYEYKILNSRTAVPTRRLYAHFCYFPLDLEKMRCAAALLLGEHDFASFCSNPRMKKSTVRKVDSIQITRKESYLNMTFHGTGFLQHMVRILSGTLLEVGFGKRAPESMEELLDFLAEHMSNESFPPQQARAYFAQALPKLDHWKNV